MTVQSISSPSTAALSASVVRRGYAAYSEKYAAALANIASAATASPPDTAADGASSGYRLTGPGYTLAEMAQRTGKPIVAYQMSEAQLKEIQLREQQERAREQANYAYAWNHRDQPIGQVVKDGTLIATVFDRGGVEYPHSALHLSSDSLSPEQMLAEIAQATHGQIIHGNFLPTMGGWSGPGAPESELPPITARSLSEIFAQEILPALERQAQERTG